MQRILLTGFALAIAGPAAAENACGTHDAIASALATKYGESMAAQGLQSSTRLYEVWRSNQSGSWTILMVLPNGTACVMATGFSWIEEEPELPGNPS